MLFDVARGLARRVPLTKLVQLDGDVRPYLASLMVSALHRAGDKLVIPKDMQIEKVTREHFENMLAREAGRSYDNYGMIADQLVGKGGTEAEVEQVQRDRMEEQLRAIAKAVEHLTREEGEWQDGGHKGHMDVSAVLQSDHGDRIAAAVVHVARKVEDRVPGLKVAAATPDSRPTAPATRGSLLIKQVRRSTGKIHAARPAAAPSPTSSAQPHIEVAVTTQGEVKPSKWEDAAPTSTTTSRGHMMIDTGAAVTVITKAWADAHGLRVTPSQGVSIRGADGMEVSIIGTAAMTVQLSPTLEVDVANVTVSAGSFYQALLGCDLLYGKPGILGAAVVQMTGPGQEGSIQWRQTKLGCIAVATFMAGPASVNAATSEYLPPPPPRRPHHRKRRPSRARELSSRRSTRRIWRHWPRNGTSSAAQETRRPRPGVIS